MQLNINIQHNNNKQAKAMKLYLKNNSYLNVTISKDYSVKYISVYYAERSGVLLYLTNESLLILGDGVTELHYADLQDITEIMANFNQYYNMLAQVSMSEAVK